MCRFPATHQTIGANTMRMPVFNCGCGCLGKEQTVLQLENYRDHLKAELTAVEKQLQAIQKSE
jgi:hypothetical protein